MRLLKLALGLGLTLGLISACTGEDPPETPSPLDVTTESLPNGVAGAPYSATLTASGGSGAGYVWSVRGGDLPAGLVLAEDGTPSTTLSGTPSEVGRFEVTISVRDSAGASAEGAFTIEIRESERPLAILTTSLPAGRVGEDYDAALDAEDGSNAGYVWSVSAGALPPGLSLEAEGTPRTSLSGMPTEAGQYTFTVQVQDSSGNRDEQDYEVTITDGLAITTPQLPAGLIGVAYDAAVSAVGGTEAEYAWTVLSGALPDGLTLSSTGTPSARISGEPTAEGEYSFELQVTDSAGETASRRFSITVTALQPLRIRWRSLPSGLEGEAYTASVAATGGSESAYAWSVVEGSLPPGLTLSASGTPETTIAGVPTESGTFQFTLRVEDDLGHEDDQAFEIVIDRVVIPIQIATSSVPNGAVGTPYQATLRTVPGTGFGALYNWTVLEGALPPGLTIDQQGVPDTQITGTPTAGGTFTATIAVFDEDNSSDSAVYTFEIFQPTAIATAQLPMGQLNTPYSAVIDGIGGTEAGYTWSVVAGALPAGLSLDPSGTPSTTLSGTPTAFGDFQFTIQLTDSAGSVATQAFELTIIEGLILLSADLPGAVQYATYTATVGAIGGSGAGYTWTVSAGTLPPGLMLSPTGTPEATISGRPTDTGLFLFTLQVTDSDGATSTADFQIEVTAADRWFAWVGDTRVDAQVEVFVAGLPGISDPTPVPVSPPLPGGNAATSNRYTQFSPDGTKIAFRGDFQTDGVNELFVVDLSGAAPGPAMVVNGPLVSGGVVTEFAWSPDSTRIAYQADQDTDGVSELFVVDVSGPVPGPSVKVSGPMVPGGFVQSQDFSWSPDGSRIAYQADELVDNDLEIFVVDVGGAVPGPSQRVNGPLPAGADTDDRWVWTPSGTHIIYQADQDVLDVQEVYMVDVSGPTPGTPVKLNGPMISGGDVGTSDWDIAVSPDGLWMSYVADQDTDGTEELYVVDISGPTPGAPVKVSGPAQSFTDNINVAWSPAGSKLAYVADESASSVYEVYYVNLTGGSPEPAVRIHPPIPSFGRVAAGAAALAWSSDGARIAYRADTVVDNAFQVEVVDITGSTPSAPMVVVPPRSTGKTIDAFAFSPDGTRVAARGENVVEGDDELFVTDLVGPNAGVVVSVTGPPLTGGAVRDMLWVGDSRHIVVEADLLVANDIEAYLIDVTNPVIPPVPANDPLPSGGDVSTLFVRPH